AGDHLAAAAAQLLVGARAARLALLAPGAEAGKRVGALPVGRQLADRGPLRLGRGEAAGGRRPGGLGRDQNVAADAAVDGQLGEELGIGAVVSDHRRVGAIELDANSMAARRGQHRRQELAMLLVGAAEAAVDSGAASRGLEAKQLDLAEAAAAG